MASSIKALLRSKTNKAGQHPLVIRITKNRKSTFIYTGYYLEKKFWDEKNQKVKKAYPNSSRLNNFIATKIAEANKTLLELENQNKVVSSEKVKKELVNPINGKTFNEISSLYLNELEAGNKISRYKADKVRVNHFISFCKSEKIFFQEITETKLRKFMSYLEVNKQVSKRSVVNNLVVIRTIYNKAIKMGILDRKLYPFGADKIRIKFPETEKIGLTQQEIKKIRNIQDLTPEENHTRNVWLFSFYLAGMRVGDVLTIRWSDIYDERLHYRMNKNSKLLTLKLPEKTLPILEQYKATQKSNDDFIFPEMKFADMENAKDVLAKTNNATKKFNKYLARITKKAKIKKKVTMHIARHSFGNIAGDKIHPLMLQKLYRHSDLKTTINYQANFIHKEADEALDSVINF